MNTKTTIGLVLFLLIVLACFLLLDQQPPGSTTARRLLFTPTQLPTDQVATLTIERPGEPTAVFSRIDGRWMQTQPIRYPLAEHPDRVQSLITLVTTLQHTERFKPGEDQRPTLAQAGLDQPTHRIRFQGLRPADARDPSKPRDTFDHVLILGRSAIGGKGYVQVNDDPHVMVVEDSVHKLLTDNPLSTWRSRNLTDVPDARRATRIELRHGDKAMVARKLDSDWTFDGPQSGRVSQQAVSRLLDDLSAVHVSQFVTDAAEDLARFGLREPQVMLAVAAPTLPGPSASATPAVPPTTQPAAPQTPSSDGDLEQYVLRIGHAVDFSEQSFYATWSHGDEPSRVVLQIDSRHKTKFEMPVDELRDKRLVLTRQTAVNDLKVTVPGRPTIHLQRGTDGWGYGDEPLPFPLDAAEVVRLIEAITTSEATAFEADFDPPQQEPTFTITLGATGQPHPEVVRLFRRDVEDKVEYISLRADERIGYVVAADRLAAVAGLPLSLRDRMVLPLRPGDIARVTLDRAGLPPALVFEAVAEQVGPALPEDIQSEPVGRWRLVGHDRFEADAFERMLTALLPLRAERWLDNAPAPAVANSITLETHDGTTHTFILDAATHTVVSGADMPFVLADTVARRISEEFRHRTPLAVRPDQIERIEIVQNGTELTLRRDERGDFVADDDVALDQAAVGGMFDQLAALRIDRWLLSEPQGPQRLAATVHLKDGSTHTLRIVGEEERPRTAEVNGRWYLLDLTSANNLNAAFVERVD